MPKELLVFGQKTFRISVPDDAKITFSPFSPPGQRDMDWARSGRAAGTLRIYQGNKDNILAVFSQVTGFRDLSLDYAEEVVVEEGATIWKSDQHGYMREEKTSARKEWVEEPAALEAPRARRNSRSKAA